MSLTRGFWLLSAAAIASAWFARPLVAPDELRYLSVSWEMHAGGAWLVPALNGEPYSHKPPLLFWGHRLGWEIFGVNAWWPRLLQALGAALALVLIARVARALSPDSDRAPACALLLFGGGFAFQLYASSILFDVWLAAFVFLAWLGLLRACPAAPETAPAPRRGWTIFALAAAAAILTKGPAALISILPPALLLPWWAAPRNRGARAWAGLALALAAACALALAWALPAARAGGEEYGRAILFGQTAGRLQDSFAHARPFWWYLALLPALALPWCAAPALWRRRAPGAGDGGERALARFGLCAFVPALLLFSAVSGKQPHYLLPALGGLALAAAPRLARAPHRLARLALLGPLLIAAGYAALRPTLQERYDLRPPAAEFAAAQAQGRATAFFGAKYHGHFHFLGRLRAPVANPGAPRAQRRWLADHPDGLVALLLADDAGAPLSEGAISLQACGSRRLALWRAADLAPRLFPE